MSNTDTCTDYSCEGITVGTCSRAAPGALQLQGSRPWAPLLHERCLSHGGWEEERRGDEESPGRKTQTLAFQAPELPSRPRKVWTRPRARAASCGDAAKCEGLVRSFICLSGHFLSDQRGHHSSQDAATQEEVEHAPPWPAHPSLSSCS